MSELIGGGTMSDKIKFSEDGLAYTVKGDRVQIDGVKVSMIVPMSDLRKLVADYVRMEWIKRMEKASADEKLAGSL